MALTACMQCLKSCGYLCGLLAALNIWFWLGMTIFNAMGNPWINMEILKEDFAADTSRFTTVFAIVLVVSTSLSSSKLIWSFSNVYSWTCFAWSDAAFALRWTATLTKTQSCITQRAPTTEAWVAVDSMAAIMRKGMVTQINQRSPSRRRSLSNLTERWKLLKHLNYNQTFQIYIAI